MTAVANTPYTAAQHNLYSRDNLNETAPAKATTVGSLFTGNGVNSIVERIPSGASVTASVATTSSSYTDLTGSPGPAITMVTGTSALIWIAAAIQHSVADKPGYASCAVSGASTIAASDAWAITAPSRLIDNRLSSIHRFTGLTPGSNTFTMKYRSFDTSSCAFANREVFGIPL